MTYAYGFHVGRKLQNNEKKTLALILICFSPTLWGEGYIEFKPSIPSNDANNAQGEPAAIWRNHDMAPTTADNFPNDQNWWSILQLQYRDTRYDAQLAFGLNNEDLWLRFNYIDNWHSWKRVLVEDKNGRIGIGTSTPSHKLSVNGSIRAKEVIVDTGWSDFVFEGSYRLRSLDEVESHIEAHGHLPDVPSAAVVESEGLSVGEAQKIMMQKIEELTLYMIEKDRQVSTLQAEVEELKKRLSQQGG